MSLQAEEGSRSAGAPASAEAQQEGASPPAIDVEKLADKVYRLMRDEFRIGKVRGQGRSWRSRG